MNLDSLFTEKRLYIVTVSYGPSDSISIQPYSLRKKGTRLDSKHIIRLNGDLDYSILMQFTQWLGEAFDKGFIIVPHGNNRLKRFILIDPFSVELDNRKKKKYFRLMINHLEKVFSRYNADVLISETFDDNHIPVIKHGWKSDARSIEILTNWNRNFSLCLLSALNSQ